MRVFKSTDFTRRFSIKKYLINATGFYGKIFAIGDIHGCIEKLRALMDSLAVNQENDTLVFIGDYIDRGKYSKEVVDYVLALQKEYRHMVCLLGNHEKMFLRYSRDGGGSLSG